MFSDLLLIDGISPCPLSTNRKNLTTIYGTHEGIKNVKNYTHVAHVVFRNWVSKFRSIYDAPAGILHNAKIVDMNRNMQKATDWYWEEDEISLMAGGCRGVTDFDKIWYSQKAENEDGRIVYVQAIG